MAEEITPGAARAARAKGETAQASVTVLADGVPYTFRPGEITALLAGEFRKVSGGTTVRQLMGMSGDDADLDVMGGFIFLARRQAGEDITYETAMSEVTYGNLSIGDTEAEGDPDSPEA